jgi:hypothetical protein
VYLAPGQVASVTVPQSVVDAGGYRIQVGASIADNVDKSEHKRMDRVSTNFDVTSTVLHVANPLGGGLYVRSEGGVGGGDMGAAVGATAALSSPPSPL